MPILPTIIAGIAIKAYKDDERRSRFDNTLFLSDVRAYADQKRYVIERGDYPDQRGIEEERRKIASLPAMAKSYTRLPQEVKDFLEATYKLVQGYRSDTRYPDIPNGYLYQDALPAMLYRVSDREKNLEGKPERLMLQLISFMSYMVTEKSDSFIAQELKETAILKSQEARAEEKHDLIAYYKAIYDAALAKQYPFFQPDSCAVHPCEGGPVKDWEPRQSWETAVTSAPRVLTRGF